MSKREIPLREARAQLGHLADRAEHHGETIIVTRYGRPSFRIAPIEEPAMTYTSADLRDQVRIATDASEGTYDVDAIVAEIVDRYGAVPVDDIESDEFWEIVGSHATEKPAMTPTDITVTRPADWDEMTSDWDGAEAATEAWLAAARAAGLEVELESIEVDDVNREVAIVAVAGQRYVLEVRSDEVRAVPTRPSGPQCTHQGRHEYVDGRCTLAPATITLVSAVVGDQIDGTELAELGDMATRLPADAKAWMDEQGYGEDPDELIYVLNEDAEIPAGHPVFRLDLGA